MTNLDSIESTLFVPLLGRAYCSRKFPQILNDAKALKLAATIDRKLIERGSQSQYTLMASAVRSHNMDFFSDFYWITPKKPL